MTIGNSVIFIGSAAFRGCSSLTSVHITDIAAWCNIFFDNPFSYAHHLYLNGKEVTDLVIPNSVTSIGNYAFKYCTGLTSVTIPNSVTIIGTQAFNGCSGLTSVTIPNSVTSIEYEAFRGCSSLTSITIPNSVTSINDWAFIRCSSLNSITSLIENPFKIFGKNSGNRTFDVDIFNNATLYVPKGTIEKYRATEGWKDFVIILPLIKNYNLSYIVDGKVYQSVSVEEGKAITPIDEPSKEGYSFSGWSGLPATMPANDVTVTGTFTVNKYTITYVVDGVTLTTEEVEYGTTITPPTSQKDGYEISWNAHPTTMPAYGITIYGSYISTGIENYNREAITDNRYFNLNGQRIEGQPSQKGVYIKNGKKVLMK